MIHFWYNLLSGLNFTAEFSTLQCRLSSQNWRKCMAHQNGAGFAQCIRQTNRSTTNALYGSYPYYFYLTNKKIPSNVLHKLGTLNWCVHTIWKRTAWCSALSWSHLSQLKSGMLHVVLLSQACLDSHDKSACIDWKAWFTHRVPLWMSCPLWNCVLSEWVFSVVVTLHGI